MPLSHSLPLVQATIGQAINSGMSREQATALFGDQALSLGRNVASYGAKPDGSDAGAGINAAIAASKNGQAVLFPGGTYTVETSILLKADRAYIALGTVILQQKASTEMDYVVKVDPAEAYPRRHMLWQGIWIDGQAMDPNTGAETNNTLYTEINGLTDNNGMLLDSVQFSNFIDLHIMGCGRDGLVLHGTEDPSHSFDKTTSTCHFISPYVYGNGRYGVYFAEWVADNHVFDGDIGANNYENVYVIAGSSSFRNSTIWGSRRANGALLGGPTNQIIGCQIEGNAQHGVKITDYGNYNFLSANKIYYNSQQTPGAYDGINVGGGGVGFDPRFTTITGNNIYAGVGDFFLDSNRDVDPTLWVGHRHAIALETACDHSFVDSNRVDLNAPGAGYGTTYPDSYNILGVFGLKAGDEYNGVVWSDSTQDAAQLSASTLVPGEFRYRNDTGDMLYYSGPARANLERILTDKDVVRGEAWVTTVPVVVVFARPDDQYTVVVSPSWDAGGWWITDKTSTGFVANFSTYPGDAGAHLDWALNT